MSGMNKAIETFRDVWAGAKEIAPPILFAIGFSVFLALVL